jgi:hypothetical protein
MSILKSLAIAALSIAATIVGANADSTLPLTDPLIGHW